MQKVSGALHDLNLAMTRDQMARHSAKPLLEMFAQNAALQMGSVTLPSLNTGMFQPWKEGELVCWFEESIIVL